MEMLQGVWKQHLRPRAVVGYGVKIFLPSPPNYVTRSPGFIPNFDVSLPHRRGSIVSYETKHLHYRIGLYSKQTDWLRRNGTNQDVYRLPLKVNIDVIIFDFTSITCPTLQL